MWPVQFSGPHSVAEPGLVHQTFLGAFSRILAFAYESQQSRSSLNVRGLARRLHLNKIDQHQPCSDLFSQALQVVPPKDVT